jgi:hypothetical protein
MPSTPVFTNLPAPEFLFRGDNRLLVGIPTIRQIRGIIGEGAGLDFVFASYAGSTVENRGEYLYPMSISPPSRPSFIITWNSLPDS